MLWALCPHWHFSWAMSIGPPNSAWKHVSPSIHRRNVSADGPSPWCHQYQVTEAEFQPRSSHRWSTRCSSLLCSEPWSLKSVRFHSQCGGSQRWGLLEAIRHNHLCGEGHEDGFFMGDSCPYECSILMCLCAVGKHNEKVAAYSWGGESCPGTESANTLVLGFPYSATMRRECLSLRTPSLCILLEQPKLRQPLCCTFNSYIYRDNTRPLFQHESCAFGLDWITQT